MSTVKKFMRLPAVMEATGRAKTTIYDDMKAGTFPAAVRIGLRAVAWDADEIAKWQESCMMKKDGPVSAAKAR